MSIIGVRFSSGSSIVPVLSGIASTVGFENGGPGLYQSFAEANANAVGMDVDFGSRKFRRITQPVSQLSRGVPASHLGGTISIVSSCIRSASGINVSSTVSLSGKLE